jgi:hypothetical protein
MAYLKLTITDTMGFWDNYIESYAFNPERSKTFTNWYRLPEEWWDGDKLDPSRKESLLRHLYGENWRMGNGDGSQYVVLKSEEHRLSAEEEKARPWEGTSEACYALGEDGALATIDRNGL